MADEDVSCTECQMAFPTFSSPPTAPPCDNTIWEMIQTAKDTTARKPSMNDEGQKYERERAVPGDQLYQPQQLMEKGFLDTDTYPKQLDHGIDPGGKPQTMMICNIPCLVGKEEVRQAIQSVGFSDAYDFLSIPHQHHAQKAGATSNQGFAFVNFHSARDAEQFARTFKGYKFPGTNSPKECIVKVADVQGFNAGKKSRRK